MIIVNYIYELGLIEELKKNYPEEEILVMKVKYYNSLQGKITSSNFEKEFEKVDYVLDSEYFTVKERTILGDKIKSHVLIENDTQSILVCRNETAFFKEGELSFLNDKNKLEWADYLREEFNKKNIVIPFKKREVGLIVYGANLPYFNKGVRIVSRISNLVQIPTNSESEIILNTDEL